MAELQRTIFETSRAAEYFEARELQAQTGQPTENFATVILKELVDNALDACEVAGVSPVIEIEVIEGDDIQLTVSDNGTGLELETVQRILNFQTRTSDKTVYKAPTRGAQGNALKTILGIPYALGGDSPLVIEARGICHTIHAWTDPAGELQINYDTRPTENGKGTRVSVTIPNKHQAFSPTYWAQSFALFNPHALVKIRKIEKGNYRDNFTDDEDEKISETYYQPGVTFPGGWRKFLPTDLTAPAWYQPEDLKRLIFSHINLANNGGQDLTLRDFVRQFRSLSGSAKAKAVCDQFPDISYLTDFQNGNEQSVDKLWLAMNRQAKPPSHNVLGIVSSENFETFFDGLYGVKRFWYKKATGSIDDIPFVFEIALAETHKSGDLYHAVNFSPTFEDPLANTWMESGEITAHGVRGFLSEAHVSPIEYSFSPVTAANTAAAFHLICPSLQFLDRGKTRLKIPEEMADSITKALWLAVQKLYKEHKRREKDAAKQERRERGREKEIRRAEKARQCTLKDAVFEVLQDAVALATGNGSYPVSARNLYYKVRTLIQQYTSKELDYGYFSQDLLTQYRDEFGPIKELYHDPRGVLYEPHNDKVIQLGTREVQSYQFPSWLYDKILYIEKKGLWPILETARLAEKYDMAVIATEGYATEAIRVLFERAEKSRNYTLLVLHDADPDGYNIARTLSEETRRMPGYSVNVIDLGLKLQEAIDMGLAEEEFTRKKALPEGLKLNDLELEYFGGRKVGRKSWLCRRVELNAFSAPELISHIEQKLEYFEKSEKVIPDSDSLLELTEGIYKDEIASYVSTKMDRLLSMDTLIARLQKSYKDEMSLDEARRWITETFETNRFLSWRKVVSATISKKLYTDLDNTIRDELIKHLKNRDADQ
jgi:hypothetical protein